MHQCYLAKITLLPFHIVFFIRADAEIKRVKPSSFLVLFTQDSSGSDSTPIVDSEALNIFTKKTHQPAYIKRQHSQTKLNNI